MEDCRPVRESDYALFQRFSGFIRRALSVQSRSVASQFVSLKAIFGELLQSLPVSKNDMNRALSFLRSSQDGARFKRGGWICIVIRSANKGKTLPGGYLCTVLEEMLTDCTALSYEDMLVAYCVCDIDSYSAIDYCEVLEPYLHDMNFVAGISTPFKDIFKARSYYLQASCALETGYSRDRNRVVFEFSDYALTYLLLHCSGQFDLETVFPPGLAALLEHQGGVDYWDTLRHYLDNESNASKTAQELFLHRSTLLPRLEKIKTLVDMDTPEQRLYLRMCIYLYELLNAKDESRK